MLNVVIDCRLIPPLPVGVSTDADNVDGFYIDYNPSPAHLHLVSEPCERLKVDGVHHVDILGGCHGIF